NFVHDLTRDTIRQALMGARPVPSFAAAASASSVTLGWDKGAYFGGITPAPEGSAVPRAVIPPMEDFGLGSGVGSDGGFDLANAPMQPVEQRIPFSSGSAIGAAAIAPAQISSASAWAGNLAPASADAPATLPRSEQIADLKPLGQVNASFIVAV